MNKTIETKFGHAYIDGKGYYKISGGKYKDKLLHRLVFTDFYGLEDIDDFFDEPMHIHHDDGDKLNNAIYNLIPLTPSEHHSLHMKGKVLSDEHKQKISEVHKGKKLSEETKKNISKAQNTTGYFRVTKQKNPKYKQGFLWIYEYYVDGKYKRISSVDIKKLEEKVKIKGLEWYKLGDVDESCNI